MNGYIIDISELSDSKELMDSRPFRGSVIFIYLLIFLILSSLVFTYFAEMDIVVKSRGEVRPYEKVGTLKNTRSGTLLDINFENGDYVNQGDVIYRFSASDLDTQLVGVNKQLTKLNGEIVCLESFKESILNEENLFDISLGGLEESFYYRYENYSLKLVQNENLIIKYKYNIDELSKKIIGNNQFLSSVNTMSNKFENELLDSTYYQSYQSFRYTFNDLNSKEEMSAEKLKQYGVLLNSGAIPKKDYVQVEQIQKNNLNMLEKFMADKKVALKSDIESDTEKMKNYEHELNSLIVSTNNTEVSLYQTETIISVNNEIQKIKTDFESLQERKGSLEFNIDKSVIKATKTGSLALTQDYSIGDYIEAGLVIGTIIPDDGKTLKVQMYVSNNDIGLINIGDKVKYKFDALSYKEYGVLEGQIDKISVDSQKSNSQTPSYYLVETTLNNEKLYSYKGLEAEMRVGMTLEAHTVTERKKVLLYLLEKIDLWG